MSAKKRKIGENYLFQKNWKIDYFFIEQNEKPMCLICRTFISQLKASNVKRHYDTTHLNAFRDITGKLREEKLKDLKKLLATQQNLFKKQTD
jgi:hypothetical protein